MVIERFGDSKELQPADIPVPEPKAGQVRIRMAYASVNPADWKTRAGLLPHVKSMGFPLTIGMDGSGVIDKVGEGVRAFKPGDKVITLSGMGNAGLQGTYAKFCVAPARRTMHLPSHLSLAEGATIPIAAASAASSILDVARVKSGDLVFYNGGAGSVGNFAIQFLRFLGARVASTCSTRNLEHVRALGAELVIDYTKDDVLAALRKWAPDGLDVIIDGVGQHSLPARTPDAIKDGGVLVVIQNLLTGPEAFDLKSAEARKIWVVDNVVPARKPDATEFQVDAFLQLLEGVRAQRITPPPYEIVPLEDAPAAHDRVQDGHVRGKILLCIDGELS
jgi:NADPH:quinone reductase-like Zn-dependent oxidoreductase